MIQWVGWVILLILLGLTHVTIFSWWVTWRQGTVRAAGMSGSFSLHVVFPLQGG